MAPSESWGPEVYLYPEAFETELCQQLIELAVAELRAFRHPLAYGRVTVHVDLDDLPAGPSVTAVRLGGVDEPTRTVPAPRAEVRARPTEWSAVRSTQPLKVDESGPESVAGMRLAEDLEALGEWRLALLTVEQNAHPYQGTVFIGLGSELFGDDGQWRDPGARRAFEDFVAKARSLKAGRQTPAVVQAAPEELAERQRNVALRIAMEGNRPKTPTKRGPDLPGPSSSPGGPGGAGAAARTKSAGSKKRE